MKYWEIGKVLAYGRHFNFINGSRSIGKTYTTLKYIIKRCVEKNEEFVYIVRNQNEKKGGCLQAAFAKVLNNEYPSLITDADNECLYLCELGDDEKPHRDRVLGYCIALTETGKMKKKSFPKVKWMVMDEYMIENSTQHYVTGWHEPDLILNLYDTIDRDEDRVVCFFLGNNTTFYNPYHLHQAFRIPMVQPGEIWTSENVLFQWAVSTEEVNEKQANTKFRKMIAGTKYGSYATNGTYAYDSSDFIMCRPVSAKYSVGFAHAGSLFSIWEDDNKIFIDACIDLQRQIFCIDPAEMKTGYILLNTSHPIFEKLSVAWATSSVYFSSPEVKARCLDLFNKMRGIK